MNKKILNTLLIASLALSTSACHVVNLVVNTVANNSTLTDNTSGDQGSASNPLSIGTYPVSNYSGSVGPDYLNQGSGTSYYRVDGISPGGTYTVTLTNVNGNPDLVVSEYSDLLNNGILCWDGTSTPNTDRNCSTNENGSYPSGTSLYIVVGNQTTTKATYNISVQ